VALLADCLAPGLLVAQAVGRVGNWWNQELFGKPTSLPWGLEIDPVHRPLATIDHATYHPAFLYEIIWNLAAAAFLVFVVERRFHPRPPGLFALYIALYSFGRFWIELIRVDPANHILGLRVNTWVSGLVFVAGLVWFYLSQRRPKAEGTPTPATGPKMSVPKGRVRPGG
jgi:prolipoprotein diacylglyceryl transferase